MEFKYIQAGSRYGKYTFMQEDLYRLVCAKCEGRTLNLFAGMTRLIGVDEIRNDIDSACQSDFHMDALELVSKWDDGLFGTVILDPPFSYRQAVDKYNGHNVTNYRILKDRLLPIVKDNARIITFGYNTTGMGKSRGFEKEMVVIVNYGGNRNDVLGLVERRRQMFLK